MARGERAVKETSQKNFREKNSAEKLNILDAVWLTGMKF